MIYDKEKEKEIKEAIKCHKYNTNKNILWTSGKTAKHTKVVKTTHKKVEIEQHEPYKKTAVNPGSFQK